MVLSLNYKSVDLKSRIESLSSLELLLLCYERLLDELLRLRSVIEDGSRGEQKALVLKIRKIIQRALIDALDFEAQKDIAKSLFDTYQWSIRQILLAQALKDQSRIDAVIESYRILLEGWRTLQRSENRSDVATSELARVSYVVGV